MQKAAPEIRWFHFYEAQWGLQPPYQQQQPVVSKVEEHAGPGSGCLCRHVQHV